MGHPQLEPTTLGEDNVSTFAMINNDCNGQKTKHIEIRFNLIRRTIAISRTGLSEDLREEYRITSAVGPMTPMVDKPRGPESDSNPALDIAGI